MRASTRTRVLALTVGLAGLATWSAPTATAGRPQAAVPTATVTSVLTTGVDRVDARTCAFSVEYVVTGLSGRDNLLAELNLVLSDGSYTNGDLGTVTRTDNGTTRTFASQPGDGWGVPDGESRDVVVKLYTIKKRGDRVLVSSSAPHPATFDCDVPAPPA